MSWQVKIAKIVMLIGYGPRVLHIIPILEPTLCSLVPQY